jgi:branched-chain amino acid transport system substrate-binding protein
MKHSKSGLRRRDVLKGTGALAGVAAVTKVTGFPNIARAQANPIRVGMPTILSGRVAILGETSRTGAQLAVDEVNEAGGINGRLLELIVRDSRGAPDEAARVTRDLINTEQCEIIIDAEASSGAFAVQEVIRELPVLCIHTNSETTSLSADPSIRTPTAFRSARQGIHDAVGGGRRAAEASRELGLTRWMSISPDYAYGRDNTAQFLEFAQKFEPSIEIVDQSWPSLFEADYTAFVTRMMQTAPDAVYSALWGGDLVAFVEQANLYGLFGPDTTFFSVNLADPPILHAISELPAGLFSVYRYDPDYPDNEANRQFAERHMELSGSMPTNWSWENYTGARFVIEGLRATDGNTDAEALSAAIRGMDLESPFSETGIITMRAEDQTIIGYPLAWGRTANDPRRMVDWQPSDWDEIVELETEWKREQGYL